MSNRHTKRGPHHCVRCQRPLTSTVALVSDTCPSCPRVFAMKGGADASPPRELTPAASSTPAPRRPTDAEMLERIRALGEAKPFRAAMLHYSGARLANGPAAPTTIDAELHAYRLALELVVAMLGKGIA